MLDAMTMSIVVAFKMQAKGAFIYDVRFLGRYVGQAASDFTKEAYVVKYLIRVGR